MKLPLRHPDAPDSQAGPKDTCRLTDAGGNTRDGPCVYQRLGLVNHFKGLVKNYGRIYNKPMGVFCIKYGVPKMDGL